MLPTYQELLTSIDLTNLNVAKALKNVEIAVSLVELHYKRLGS